MFSGIALCTLHFAFVVVGLKKVIHVFEKQFRKVFSKDKETD
jgi:hypothetical protein